MEMLSVLLVIVGLAALGFSALRFARGLQGFDERFEEISARLEKLEKERA